MINTNAFTKKREKCGKEFSFEERVGLLEIKTYKMKWIDTKDLLSTPAGGNYDN